MSNNNECPWKPGEEYTTRDGHRARVYCIDGGGRFPIHGATMEQEVWALRMWAAKGGYMVGGGAHHLDLVPPKQPHKWWDNGIAKVVVWHGHVTVVFDSDTDEVYLTRADLEHMLVMLDEAGGGGCTTRCMGPDNVQSLRSSYLRAVKCLADALPYVEGEAGPECGLAVEIRQTLNMEEPA